MIKYDNSESLKERMGGKLKSCIIACFGNFYHGIKNSNSMELKLLGNLASKDIRSTTGANISGTRKLWSRDPRVRIFQ